MMFACVSGTATADTAGMGSMLIPAMIKKGYPAGFTAAITAASSTMGAIIPPASS
jgi:TRAP-type C4-dicarboxylate transport system permease large subunit